jgi:hypothetical protein
MQLPAPSYDESLVPAYELPELLQGPNGSRVTTAEAWAVQRRPELLELFRRHVYGSVRLEHELRVVEVVRDAPACGGLARRTELDVAIAGERGSLTMRVLIFEPSQRRTPVPAFLGLNLFGNQTVHPDPALRLSQGWAPVNEDLGLTGNVHTEASRGLHAGRFAVEMLVSRGYALVTAYVGDMDPDFDDGFHNGIHALLPEDERRAPDAPGALAAWAFGFSRLLDVVQHEPGLDAQRVAAFGHSRLGKTALWAAAEDPRFALAISNESGCGGAALSRRRYGERLLHINRRFPHWFCPAFHAYDEREHELPIDQHQLLALLAPRPLYVASAAGDQWADPKGEELACRFASPAWELAGLRGLAADGSGLVGYHQRPGKHDITPRDWWHYLQFADTHLASP